MEKGKNFSTNNATGKRKLSDHYPTHYSLTRLLLEKIGNEIKGNVLEPCSGEKKAICKVLNEFNIDHQEYDLNFGENKRDFLKESNHFDFIITNPPFSLSTEFINKAKEVSDNFIFLLPLSYLHGKNVMTRFIVINLFHLNRYLFLQDIQC